MRGLTFARVKTMNLTLTSFIPLVLALAHAKDICDHTDMKKRPGFHSCQQFIHLKHGSFTKSDLQSIGESSSVCTKLTGTDWADLEGRASLVGSKALIELLPFKCIKNAAENGHFDLLYSPLSGGRKKRITDILEKHSAHICSSKKKFEGTDIEKDLEHYCKETKQSKVMSELRDEHDKLNEENAAMKFQGRNDASMLKTAGPIAVLASAILIGIFI